MNPRFAFSVAIAVMTAVGCIPQSTVEGPAAEGEHAQLKVTVTPFLMFEGRAEEAMNFYVDLFPDAQIESIQRFEEGSAGEEGTVERAVVQLAGQRLMFFDSHIQHQFTFTPAISFFVNCTSESQIDEFFNRLSEDGEVMMPPGDYGFSEKFAWLQDRFGVSWQLNLPSD